MRGRHELYDQPPILDPLDGPIARVHRKLLADGLLDRDLAALTDPAWHIYCNLLIRTWSS